MISSRTLIGVGIRSPARMCFVILGGVMVSGTGRRRTGTCCIAAGSGSAGSPFSHSS